MENPYETGSGMSVSRTKGVSIKNTRGCDFFLGEGRIQKQRRNLKSTIRYGLGLERRFICFRSRKRSHWRRFRYRRQLLHLNGGEIAVQDGGGWAWKVRQEVRQNRGDPPPLFWEVSDFASSSLWNFEHSLSLIASDFGITTCEIEKFIESYVNFGCGNLSIGQSN